ncbi:hypothetical protein BD414DRAFT_490031 [Trametes punicea]|nr:hypothetical protein BD414DRAFT_490031 [Trametes punicea]
MPMPQLPQELIDAIIDAVVDANDEWRDEDTLRSCTLTSRFWVTKARSHLFSTITLMEPPTVAAFTNLILSPPRVKLHLIPLVPVRHLVRHLRLGAPMPLDGARRGRECGFSFFTIHDIPTTLLEHLDTLSIAKLPDVHFSPTYMPSLHEDFRFIKNLRLNRGFIASQTLAQLLSGFPELSSLKFTYDCLPPDRLGICLLDDSPPPMHLPLSVRELGLGLPDMPIVQWLVDQGGLAYDQLHSLSILFQPLGQLQALQSMLRHCSKTLTELSVGYANPPFVLQIGTVPRDRAEFTKSLCEVFEASPIKDYTGLRFLRVEGCDALEEGHTPHLNLHSWIPSLLRQIRSERIEEVTFAFRRIRQADLPLLSWIDWSAIGALFESSPLSSVQRLIVEVAESEVARQELYEWLAVLLPWIARRDALRVRCIKEIRQGDRNARRTNGLVYMTILDCLAQEEILSACRESASVVEEFEWYQKAWLDSRDGVDSDVVMGGL